MSKAVRFVVENLPPNTKTEDVKQLLQQHGVTPIYIDVKKFGVIVVNQEFLEKTSSLDNKITLHGNTLRIKQQAVDKPEKKQKKVEVPKKKKETPKIKVEKISKHPLIDICANLTSKDFSNDLDVVLSRAKEANVKGMMITGSSLEGSEEALKLAKRLNEQYKGELRFWSTVGIHPHDIKFCKVGVDEAIKKMEEMAKDEHVIAIGETGLDFNENYQDLKSPPEIQMEWYEKQVALACKLKKPLFLHEREAHDKFLSIVEKYKNDLPNVVIHCYTGNDEKEVEVYINRGFYIGLTTYICKKTRGEEIRKIIPKIPLDRIMIETDSPWMLPHSGKQWKGRNEPCNLPYVVSTIANCLNVSEEEVEQAVTRNTLNFFNIQNF